MAITLTSAEASPGRDDSSGVPARTFYTSRDHVEHGCFLTPASWNEALDGPLPRCRTDLT